MEKSKEIYQKKQCENCGAPQVLTTTRPENTILIKKHRGGKIMFRGSFAAAGTEAVNKIDWIMKKKNIVLKY